MSNNYYNQVRKEIDGYFPKFAETVIEIGCGEGRTLAWLKSEGRTQNTIGIEISEHAALEAKNIIDEIYLADITTDNQFIEINRNRADVILLLDVLEHLRDPGAALNKVKLLLKPNGLIIASIPNIRSVKVIFPLIFKGKFEYTDCGILDRTHVVFFTKSSIIELFKKNSLHDLEIKPSGALDIRSAKTGKGIIVSIFNILTCRLFTDFLANQWIIRVRNNN